VRRTLQKSEIDLARFEAIGDFNRGGFPPAMPLSIVSEISGDTRTYPVGEPRGREVSEGESKLGAVAKRKQTCPFGIRETTEQIRAGSGKLQRLEQGRRIPGQACSGPIANRPDSEGAPANLAHKLARTKH
jgi:hypothetical protein